MIKKLCTVCTFLFLVIPLVRAEAIRNLTVDINIVEDNEVEFDVFFRFTEEIKEIRIPIRGKAEIIETVGGKCEFREGIVNEIVCRPPSPFMVGEVSISTKFRIRNLVRKVGNVSFFSFDVPITYPTDFVKIIVRLPKGMFVSDSVEMPLSPSGSFSTVKEKRIIEIWEFENKNPGDIIPIRIYYEAGEIPVMSELFETLMGLRIIIVIFGVVLVFTIFYFGKKLKERREEVFSILNVDEKRIIDLIRSHGGKIDQRELVRLTDFSKAKVSRLVKELKERGVVEVERRGRKNRVYLKKV